MTHRTIALGAVVALTLCAVAQRAGAQAPASPLPTGEAVLAKYVEITGGEAAFTALKSRVTRGRMVITGAGVEISVTTYAAAPGNTYTVAESKATGRIESGVSDGVAWENSALRGPSVKDGAERDDAVKAAIFDRLAHWKAHLKSAECTGTAEVKGKPAYRVTTAPMLGTPETLFFDVESGLLVRVETRVTTAAGAVSVAAEPSDFRKVDGILIPFSSRMEVVGQERVVTVEKVEHNVEFPADRFALPAEVKALIKK
jgi:hypothetical protein